MISTVLLFGWAGALPGVRDVDLVVACLESGRVPPWLPALAVVYGPGIDPRLAPAVLGIMGGDPRRVLVFRGNDSDPECDRTWGACGVAESPQATPRLAPWLEDVAAQIRTRLDQLGGVAVGRWVEVYRTYRRLAAPLLVLAAEGAARAHAPAGAREDVAQEAILRALDADLAALRRIDPRTPLDRWAMSCAHNVVRERQRRRTAAPGLLGGSDALVPDPAASDPLACEPDGDDARAATPVDATARRPLSTEQREALALLCAGQSLEEIAARLHISPQAARHRLSRCVRRVSGDPSAFAAAAAPRSPRAWAEEALARPDPPLDPATVALLRAYIDGAVHGSLAAERDITVGALRQRLRRLKRRLAGGST